MIINMALATTWRPDMLYNLNVAYFTIKKHKGEEVCRIKTRHGISNATIAAGLSLLSGLKYVQSLTVNIYHNTPRSGNSKKTFGH